MELKPGYKQTEVGVIPEEWGARQIRDVCRLINGRGFKPHEWKTVGLPIIRIQNLNGSEDFNFYSGQYNPKILVEHGQLLFAWSGSRGTSFGPYIWNGGRALLNYHTWKVAVNESEVTREFFFHALRHLTSYIEDRAHGASALVHTQKWEMEKFPIPIPSSLPEQDAIAGALGDADALLGALGKLIAKKRDLKQAAMQQLLTGKHRLPGFRGEWQERELRSVVRDFIVPMRDKPEKFRGTIPWCRIEDFDGKFLTGSKSGQHVDKNIIEQMNLKLLPVGTLLVSCSADLGRCAIVKTPLVTNQTFIGLVVDETSASNEFLYYYMSYNADELNNLSSGTTISYLSREQFETFTVFIPPRKEEQTAIATVLSDMDAEIAALEQKRDKTRALKQGMMQELLAGRTRLPFDEGTPCVA